MFGIGFPELVIILVVALIVFGPKKLPELARALGKGMAEFRKATHEIKESLDMNEDLQSVRKDIADTITGLDRPDSVEKTEKAAEETAFFEGEEPRTGEEMKTEGRSNRGDRKREPAAGAEDDHVR